MHDKADRETIRFQNRGLLLRALRREGPLARVELSDLTGLSPATVTAITADLITEGVIAPIAATPPEPGSQHAETVLRGRPRTKIGLVGERARILALRIVAGEVSLVLAGFDGSVIAEDSVPVATKTETRDGFAATLNGLVADFMAKTGFLLTDVAEIAIATQGIVDISAGSLLWSPAFSARSIPVVQPLAAMTRRPVTLSNDANMVTEGLHAEDPERFGRTFAVLLLDDGIGMGFLFEGSIYHGARGAALEFGHVNHDTKGPVCRCGQRGCVEAYTATYALCREVLGLPPTTDPWDIAVDRDALDALAENARGGDDDALALFETAGRVLGISMGRFAAIADPGRVVVTGRNVGYVPLMRPAFNAGLADSLVADLREPLEFIALSWDADIVTRGLIASSLARVDAGYAGHQFDGEAGADIPTRAAE